MNNARIVLFSIALSAGLGLSSHSSAQLPPGVQPPPPKEVVVPPTVQERIARLEQDLIRLQEELQFIRDLKDQGGLTVKIANQIHQRSLNIRSVEVGIDTRPERFANRATIFTDEQRSGLTTRVMMTVNGIPVLEARVKSAYDYLKSYRPEATEEQLMGEVILGIAAAEYPKTHFERFRRETANKIRDIHSAATRGVEFENLAENRSDDRESAANGGDIGFISRDSDYGLNFTQAAFSLKEDEISMVVSSPLGMHILKRTGYEKGDTPAADRVRISHVLVYHAPSPSEIRETIDAVKHGEAEIAVRDQEFMRFMPRPYR